MAGILEMSVAASTAGCGFPRPADIGGPGVDAQTNIDGQIANNIVMVSASGSDTNDGISRPVKTLKRAIAIAVSNTDIVQVSLDAGSYSAAEGETFPYVIPAGLTLAGSSTGATILVGTTSTDGLRIDSGRLQDIDFDTFGVALTANGQVSLTRIQIKNSLMAVQAKGAAKLTMESLAATGSVDMCGAGIQLSAGSELTAHALDTNNLKYTVQAFGANAVDISKASIVGDPRCDCTALSLTGAQDFRLEDGLIIGCRVGVSIIGSATVAPKLALVNSTIRNGDTGISSQQSIITMTGGALSSHVHSSAAFYGGSGSFSGVQISNGQAAGVSALGDSTAGLASLVLRGCTLSGYDTGAVLVGTSTGDFGTDASPGGNTFQNNRKVGVSVQSTDGPAQVNAVGNTWNPSTQGADAAGKYAVATVSGPVPSVALNNYDIAAGLTLRR